MSPLTSTQTLECHPLPLHRPWNVTPYLYRPWNVTPYLYTDPGMSHLTSTQTLECHTLPLHRPWNVTPYLYTDPGMSHHQHQLDHHTHSFHSSQQHYLVHQQLWQQMAALHQKLNLISAEHLFPVPDYNQHPLFLLTLTTSSNTFQPSTEFQVQLLLQSSTPPRVLATLQST